MTDAGGREQAGASRGRGRGHRRPTLERFSWFAGAYFLGAVFLSIAHQLFAAPPAGDAPASRYHRAWCVAEFAGLRTELETQARGALAGAAFAPPPGGDWRRWYDTWRAWHGRVAAACPAAADAEVALGLADLAALGASLETQCREVAGPARGRLEAIDARLRRVVKRGI